MTQVGQLGPALNAAAAAAAAVSRGYDVCEGAPAAGWAARTPSGAPTCSENEPQVHGVPFPTGCPGMLLCGNFLPTAAPLTLPYCAEHCGTVPAALMEGLPGTDASAGENAGSGDDALRGGGPECVLDGAASQGVVPEIARPAGIVMHMRTFRQHQVSGVQLRKLIWT